jgi:hypothetical protein
MKLINEPLFGDGDTEAKAEDPEIIIVVEGGNVTSFTIDGEATRAIVHDYDVQFPVDKNTVEQDEEGRYYVPRIV